MKELDRLKQRLDRLETENPRWRSVGFAAAAMAAVVLLTSCATMSDVKPGDGYRVTITGHSYDEIWKAAIRVAEEHFDIRESDQSRGVIKAERDVSFTSWGEFVGIFITPATADAVAYTVEVVNRRKSRGQITGQGWEHKVIRDIQDVLESRPMR